jgi:vacuolar protein sorting-associated protein IST1
MFLRLALARMRLKRSKIENSIIQQRHRAAQALREGNDDQARLLVEEMFRAQHRTQALVQLLLLGEHLLTRIDAIELSPEIPPDLRVPISTLVYAAERLDVKELKQLSRELTAKYGKELADNALSKYQRTADVHSLVAECLNVYRPPPHTVYQMLHDIATQFGVEWNDADLRACAKDESSDVTLSALSSSSSSTMVTSVFPPATSSVVPPTKSSELLTSLSPLSVSTVHNAQYAPVPIPDFDNDESANTASLQAASSPSSGSSVSFAVPDAPPITQSAPPTLTLKPCIGTTHSLPYVSVHPVPVVSNIIPTAESQFSASSPSLQSPPSSLKALSQGNANALPLSATLSQSQHSACSHSKTPSTLSATTPTKLQDDEFAAEFPRVPTMEPVVPTAEIENLHFPQIRGYDGDPKPATSPPSTIPDDDQLLARFQKLKK